MSMRKKKITMVNPEQITARGWKGFKTKRAVENFTAKYHVNHVYWRAPGKKRILLVDYDHFRQTWQEFKKTTASKPSPKRSTTRKSPTSYKRKPTTRRTTSTRYSTSRRPSSTRYSTSRRSTTTRRRTTASRPKPRTRTTARRRYTRR